VLQSTYASVQISLVSKLVLELLLHSNFFGYYAGNEATNASGSNFMGNQAGNGQKNATASNFFGVLVVVTGASQSNFIGLVLV
jgi:hypothetical protein